MLTRMLASTEMVFLTLLIACAVSVGAIVAHPTTLEPLLFPTTAFESPR